MNIYKLKSGETESHIHDTVSTSTLIEGQAVMTFNGEDYEMPLNVPMTIPANTIHAMKNIGVKECKISCRCGTVINS